MDRFYRVYGSCKGRGKYFRFLIVFLVSLHLGNLLSGQVELSNLQQKSIQADTTWITLDSLTISPASVQVIDSSGQTIPNNLYEIRNNQIRLDSSKQSDSLTVQYRVFPYNFTEPLSRFNTSEIRSAYEGTEFFYNPYAEDGDGLPDFGRMSYNGSFSRGISFGNSQNLVLNSNLNLQMAGRLTEDVELSAAINDSSIPIQPEGNTAQLQEFDKVFVQLKRKKSTLIAGDYELARPQRYFMNYFRKLQGATFSNELDIAENHTLNSRASVAIARGQFARNIITPQEGNQGPYRLRGTEGERFIIVLAGTERVYLNGQLLQRGLEADYIIDYNAAGITFTPRRLINKDSRIVVEFEYTDQSYLRSLYAVDLDYKTRAARVYFSLYSDQDSKNSFADGDLTDAEKEALSRAGDSEIGALVSGVEQLEEFNPLRVTYGLKDTVICGVMDSILIYSTNPDSAIYTARFTDVGMGNGNYVLDTEQAANGRVYKWMPPINCIPQGNFAPVISLAAPRRQQLYTAGAEIRLSANAKVETEFALSNFDLNRFSTLDDANNTGWAGFTRYNQDYNLGDEENGWKLLTGLSYEYVQQDFEFLYPYRPQEFTRDWNLSNTLNGQLGDNDLPVATEQLAFGSIALEKQGWGNWLYSFGNFNREETYNGTRHYSKFSLSRNAVQAWAEASLLNSKTMSETTSFFRPKLSVDVPFFRKDESTQWVAGAYAEREYNERRLLGTDTLTPTSFYYDLARLSLSKSINEKLETRLATSRRWDYAPLGSEFRASTRANDIEWAGNWKQTVNANLEWILNYRQLTVKNESLTTEETGETYLGRVTYNAAFWKGALNSNTSYEISSGQEPRIEFNYLRVNDGEGIYQWNDYNDDGVAQQNEFEIATFQDSANFVRVTLVTDEFIRSNNVQFNQSLRLEPKAVWFSKKGFKKFVSRFSTLSSWQINRQVKVAEGVSAWNPFQLDIIDSALVALNSTIRNTLFFNRADPRYDVQLGMSDNRNRVVVTTGFESKALAEQFLKGRWNLTRQWSLTMEGRHSLRENESENFQTRNYNIENWFLRPDITWLPSTSFRIVAGYEWRNGKNLPGFEVSKSDRINLEATLNPGSASEQPTSIRVMLTYADVRFNGIANSPVGFAMLEGLRDGKNYLWNISFERQLVKNIRLSLNYEGRKTGDSRIVHVGRAQVAAVF